MRERAWNNAYNWSFNYENRAQGEWWKKDGCTEEQKAEQRDPGDESMIIHIGHDRLNHDLQYSGRGNTTVHERRYFAHELTRAYDEGSDIYRSSKHVSALWGT